MRVRRLIPPSAAAAAVAAVGVLLFAVDPNEPGHYPVCPTRLIFGIDCPGCGGLRATHDLLHGDIAAAADRNLLVVIAAPIVVGLWVLWVVSAWTGRPLAVPARVQRVLWISGAVLLVAFGLVRNVVPYLSSTA